jgi:hypothetical protein
LVGPGAEGQRDVYSETSLMDRDRVPARAIV